MLLTVVTMLLQVAPELEDGRAAFSKLEYQKAVTALTKVTASSAPAVEKAEAYGLLARSYLALGKTTQAQEAFGGQLSEDPMAEEPVGAPKVKQAFLAAKKAKFPPTYLQLVRRPSTTDSLVVELVNPWRLPVTVDAWEWSGNAEPRKKPVPLDGQRLLLALAAGSKQYLRATGSDGVVLATLGSVQAPIEGPLAPAPLVQAKEPVETQAPRDPKAAPPLPIRPVESPKATLPVPIKPVETPADPKLAAPPLPNRALEPNTREDSPEFSPLRKNVPLGSSLKNPVLGWILAGVGTAAIITGIVFVGLGISDYAKGDGFPFTVPDLPESIRLKQQGENELIIGGIVGVVGLAAVVGGVLVLLNTK